MPHSHRHVRKYPALRLVLTILRIVTWIAAGLLLVSHLVTTGAYVTNDPTLMSLTYFAIPLVLGALAFLVAFALIEIFYVLIDIEENTRKSAI